MMIFSSLLLTLVVATTPLEQPSESFAKSIDAQLNERYEQLGIEPVATVENSQFVRRIYLDLVGRIPTVEQAQRFAENPNREKLIDELIQSPDFSKFLSEAWTVWLVGYTNAFKTDRETFRIWLEDQIQRDVPFKTIVNKIISAKGSTALNGPANFLARHFDAPVPAVCRSFLGVRIECAQCHDHPFDRWTQDDYGRMSLFFETVNRREQNGVAILTDRLGNNQFNEGPRFLTGAVPRTGRFRQELALYLTNCKPFARNFANRCWYFLLGKGIVDPPDDFNQENPAADQQLLENLAQFARDTDFSIRQMFRAICLTQAYQRQTASSANEQALKLFAARTVKPLLPVQYIDSLFIAVGRETDQVLRRKLEQRLVNVRDLNEDYQRLWEYRESVQQLMRNMTFQFRSHSAALKHCNQTDLFERFLNRKMTDEERKICAQAKKEELMFALALGNEFCFNH